MTIIIPLSVVALMIAELYAILRTLNLAKEKPLKHSSLAALFPIIYIVSMNSKNGQSSNTHITEQLRSVLKQDDEKFKKSDCYSILNGLNCNTESIDNEKIILIVNSINNCYKDLFGMLPGVLNRNENYVCILHHLRVKPQVIGDILHISYATVRTHKARIKLKLSESEFDLFFTSNNITDATKI